MKLAIALFRYFPFGGLQRDMLAIARACRRQHAEVTVYAGAWEGEQPDDLAVVVLPVHGRSNHGRNRAFVRALHAALRAHPVDRVLGFDRMPGLDVYFAADTCFRAKLELERPWLYRLLPRYRHFLECEEAVFGAQSRTSILTISSRAQDEYALYYPGSRARMTLLPPGIARDRRAGPDAADRRARKRAELGLTDDQHLVLFVGSGFRTKGLDRAVLALAALPANVKAKTLLLAAGRDKAAPYARLADHHGVASRVRFLGGRSDVADLLLAADLLVHPARRESAGIVLLEAAVAGLPVLTTAVCGHATFIAENAIGTVLDEPFSREALSEALARMLEERHRQPWSANGISFGAAADIYDMPLRAAGRILGTPTAFGRIATPGPAPGFPVTGPDKGALPCR